MKLSIVDSESRSVESAAKAAKQSEVAGYEGHWIAGGWRDGVSLSLVAGREVPRITVGSSIVSIWQLPPIALAEQLLTVHDALGGRFTAGLGLSHPQMVENRFGRSFERPIAYMREYLTILMGALDDRAVTFSGHLLSASTDIRVPAQGRPPVVFAALGPQAVSVAARLVDGLLTFMVPLSSLAESTIPRAERVAAAEGRSRPRFIVELPICVTNDAGAARVDAARTFVNYGSGYYPSYRAALDRGGVDGPADVAVIGDESSVLQSLRTYRDIGVDEIAYVPFSSQTDRARTHEFLGALARDRELFSN